MKAERKFKKQPKSFWANVRLISQKVGYTVKHENIVKIPTMDDIKIAYTELGLDISEIIDKNDNLTKMGNTLNAYFRHRADVLNNYVEPRLMDADRAKEEFQRLKSEFSPKCPIPMNKQKGDKKSPAYFTGIINMLIEAHSEGFPCNYAPKELTSITRNNFPIRTFARWVDGAFPNSINPIAIWEIKEYYYTTTFGSRVADGVYETLLDGMEIEELREHENISILHYLMIDAYYTWWTCGKSYLCRIVDMLHMGYVDEVLFGYEVIERLPSIVKQWIMMFKKDRV